ncbi:unnamed protein product [Porites evermanni]|uniref:G-protein coupled receptors family 1 profile domain-containing protein n=1 Tax=Porites evermanni TaxID=104178 RepID=A0ABN8MLP1_9CNID|nr:unnamed protein product [Porites evermanni]
MEMKNFTGGENPQTISPYCSVESTEDVHGELVFLSVINTFLSITAFLGNTLILVALRKDTSIHPPSKLLYRNLAITDLCVGIIAEPLSVAYWIFVVNRRWDIFYYTNLTAYFAGVTLCSVSLITLTAISVDRLLALLLGLRYRQVVTLKRTLLIAIGGWIVSVVCASTSFLNFRIFSLYQYIVIAFCLVTTICAYTKIFMSLRHNQIHVQNHVVQGQSSQANTLNIALYRKAVYSALWVQVTLVICYLPYGIVVALTPQRGMHLSAYLAKQFLVTLVYLNSSLNPLLYCWKITEPHRRKVMELKNFTGGENLQTIAELHCSEKFTGEVHGELVFLSVINTFLSITAFLGNTLILVALRKDTSIHPSSKIMYRNLAITDLCVGIIVGPLQVAYLISVVKRRWDICYYANLTVYFAGVTLCSVSLITLTTISVDRLLALLLGLRYRQVVTLKRTRLIAIGGWIQSVVGASTSFLNPLIFLSYQYINTAFCLVTTICAYTKIFMSLRHNQIHGQNHVLQGQSSQANILNKARYRKAVYSALWVQGDAFIYLPCFAIYRYFSVFKLVVKPVSVLLEDHRSEKSFRCPWSAVRSRQSAVCLLYCPIRNALPCVDLLIQLRRHSLLSVLVVESDSVNLLPKLLVKWSLGTHDCLKFNRQLTFTLGFTVNEIHNLQRVFLSGGGGGGVPLLGAVRVAKNKYYLQSLYVYIGTAFCLVTTICAYTKIFMFLRHNQIHGQNHVVQGQSSQVNTLNIARYRKAVYSALWVQVTLVICYLPYSIAVALTPQRGRMPLSTYLALQFTGTLVCLNSSLNPFLYCWKITEVRQAVKETLQQLHFCINQTTIE